jgi:DtxR family Mn-dependent transcriptional regulator
MNQDPCKKLSRTVEDYLEAILNVTLKKGYARTGDVAKELGLTPSSVVELFKKLDTMGFVEYRKYEGVVFKPEGRKVAELIKYRHDTLREFLVMANVPDDIAVRDACYMEHELHPETIRCIRTFIEVFQEDPELTSRVCTLMQMKNKKNNAESGKTAHFTL